jgi:6,7-dimethyl-8-ribityllumazine synthase
MNILIVEARFYAHIADMLLDGAKAALEAAGAQVETITVPGALEIPSAIAFAAKAGEGAGKSYDGFVALGCVIRGETSHYDHICESTADWLQRLAVEHGLPVGYGILTCETEAQALARATPGDNGRDKGGEAVRACLAMIGIKRRFAESAA